MYVCIVFLLYLKGPWKYLSAQNIPKYILAAFYAMKVPATDRFMLQSELTTLVLKRLRRPTLYMTVFNIYCVGKSDPEEC